MKFIARAISVQIQAAAKALPIVLLTGPRQAGKTTLLRALWPRAEFILLEDPDTIDRVNSDPRSFFETLNPPVILDEIQNTPQLLNYIRARVDRSPRNRGRWLMTGAQEAPIMKGVTESLAGRAGVLQLLPLSTAETERVSVLRGGFPGVLARPSAARLWFQSYIQTYLERDVRAVTQVRELSTFRRFLALVASRCGQLLNKTELAAPLGLSVPTIGDWLSVLEITGQILMVPPYFANFGKRLIKSPKLYWLDSGLACHLLGIETQSQLRRSSFAGPLFEGFVASEIVKHQINAGRRREIYYFRDQQGLEVDFLIPSRDGRLNLIEAKASRTVTPAMAHSMTRLASAIPDDSTRNFLVHGGESTDTARGVIKPGVAAVSVSQLIKALA